MGMIRTRMCEDKCFSRINSWCKVYKPYLCGMKYIYLFIGFLSLILGVIGIFLPSFTDIGSDRYFPARPAYHALPAVVGCPVLPEFPAGLRLAAGTQIPGTVYPELPRRPDDSFAGQNRFHFFTLADGSALRRSAFRIVVAADRYGGDGHLCDGLYPVFQDTSFC